MKYSYLETRSHCVNTSFIIFGLSQKALKIVLTFRLVTRAKELTTGSLKRLLPSDIFIKTFFFFFTDAMDNYFLG